MIHIVSNPIYFQTALSSFFEDGGEENAEVNSTRGSAAAATPAAADITPPV